MPNVWFLLGPTTREGRNLQHRRGHSRTDTMLCVHAGLLRYPLRPRHVCHRQETGLFPEARTFSRTWSFLWRLRFSRSFVVLEVQEGRLFRAPPCSWSSSPSSLHLPNKRSPDSTRISLKHHQIPQDLHSARHHRQCLIVFCRSHVVEACWSVVLFAGCRCFSFLVPLSLPTRLRKHVFACTRNSPAAHSET